MLIVTRREGESICLGESLAIEIKAIEANTVTIAIISDKRGSLIHRLHGLKAGRLFQAANENRI